MIKCVVWDLDDTLWQGILKERDRLHLTKDRKELLQAIDEAGILQSIASRNEKGAAEKKLREFGIVEYFLYPQYSMHSKAVSIRKIAEALNIGTDSLVFVDDSEFELAEVSYFLPEVRTYHSKNQWGEFLGEIVAGIDEANALLPEDRKVTYESKNRRGFYLIDALREREAANFAGTREDFLKGCRMIMVIRHGTEADIPRVCELAARTNQFRSFSQSVDEHFCREYIKEMKFTRGECNSTDAKPVIGEGLSMGGIKKALYVAELSDRFANYGIIGMCFASRKDASVIMEQFCISCRVEGRGAANAFLHSVSQLAMEEMETERLQCLYMETDRNMPMMILLKTIGFHINSRQEGVFTYELENKPQDFRYGWIEIRKEGGDCRMP
jgi:FkbH-like protein